MNKKISIALIGASFYGVLYSATVREMYELVRAATNDGRTTLAPSSLTTPYGFGTEGSKKILKAAQDLLTQLEAERTAMTTKATRDKATIEKCKQDLEEAKSSCSRSQGETGTTQSELTKCKKDLVAARASIEKLKKERDDAQAALKAIIEQLQKTFGAIEQAVLSH